MGFRKAVVNLLWRFLIKHYSDDEHVIARLIGSLAPRYFTPEKYLGAFRIWEERDVHITPAIYGFPIPDTRFMTEDLWLKESTLPGIRMNEELQLHYLTKVFPQFRMEYDEIPHAPTQKREFHFNNDLFDGTDALVLYCMVRHFRPNWIIEVGSGFSSRLFTQAIRKNSEGNLVCIEPFPDEVSNESFPESSVHVKKRVEQLDPQLFQKLDVNDILFIDSSHVVKIGGDVNFLFLQIIPNLKPGVIIHVHDIFFPNEYPREWVLGRLNFWSEQYLLQAFLSFNNEFEVLLCNSFLATKYKKQMMETFPKSPWCGGSSFWFRRKLRPNG
jgi:hypothetical protein